MQLKCHLFQEASQFAEIQSSLFNTQWKLVNKYKCQTLSLSETSSPRASQFLPSKSLEPCILSPSQNAFLISSEETFNCNIVLSRSCSLHLPWSTQARIHSQQGSNSWNLEFTFHLHTRISCLWVMSSSYTTVLLSSLLFSTNFPVTPCLHLANCIADYLKNRELWE